MSESTTSKTTVEKISAETWVGVELLIVCLTLVFFLVQNGMGTPSQDPMTASNPSVVDTPEEMDMAEAMPATSYDFTAPPPDSYSLPIIQTASDGQVLDESGAAHSLREMMNGQITILSFIYTRCDDEMGCPMSTMVLHDIRNATAERPDLADNLQLISLSFDPAHDTPEVMADFKPGDVEGHAAQWRFLTTRDESDLAPILTGYGQSINRKLSDDMSESGKIFHLLRVYLIDKTGQVRNIYGLGFLDPRLLLADVETLLLEEN